MKTLLETLLTRSPLRGTADVMQGERDREESKVTLL